MWPAMAPFTSVVNVVPVYVQRSAAHSGAVRLNSCVLMYISVSALGGMPWLCHGFAMAMATAVRLREHANRRGWRCCGGSRRRGRLSASPLCNADRLRITTRRGSGRRTGSSHAANEGRNAAAAAVVGLWPAGCLVSYRGSDWPCYSSGAACCLARPPCTATTLCAHAPL